MEFQPINIPQFFITSVTYVTLRKKSYYPIKLNSINTCIETDDVIPVLS